jgi:hypothetical protein
MATDPRTDQEIAEEIVMAWCPDRWMGPPRRDLLARDIALALRNARIEERGKSQAELAEARDLMSDRLSDARAEEREACAAWLDSLPSMQAPQALAATIRARGSLPEAVPTPAEDEARVDALMAKAVPAAPSLTSDQVRAAVLGERRACLRILQEQPTHFRVHQTSGGENYVADDAVATLKEAMARILERET